MTDDVDPAERAARATEFIDARVPGQLGCVFDPSVASAIIALVDTCAATGCGNNVPDGASFTTIEPKANFLSSAREGERVACRCIPVHLGRQTQVWDAEVTNESRHAGNRPFPSDAPTVGPAIGGSGRDSREIRALTSRRARA